MGLIWADFGSGVIVSASWLTVGIDDCRRFMTGYHCRRDDTAYRRTSGWTARGGRRHRNIVFGERIRDRWAGFREPPQNGRFLSMNVVNVVNFQPGLPHIPTNAASRAKSLVSNNNSERTE